MADPTAAQVMAPAWPRAYDRCDSSQLEAAAPLIVSRADSVPRGRDSGVQPGLVTLARCPGTGTAASARPSLGLSPVTDRP
jgi:hypothetical protein